MKHSKKAGLMNNKIIAIVISVLTLLIIIGSITEILPSNTNYQQSILGCSQFLDQVDGKPMFFDIGMDKPTIKFIDATKSYCPSGEYKISEDEIFKGAKLIDDCWEKAARGENILGRNVQESNVMLYCGDLIIKEDIDGFGEKLREKIDEKKYDLFNQDESVNLNNLTLSKDILSKTIGDVKEDEKISVFYNIYVNQSAEFSFNRWMSMSAGLIGGVPLLISYELTTSEFDSYSGIVLVKELEKQINETTGAVKGFTNLKNMNVVIPTEHYKLK